MNELGTDTLFPPKQVESVAIVSLLHDICKTQSYKMEFKDQKVYSDHGTKFDKTAVLTTWNLCHSTR